MGQLVFSLRTIGGTGGVAAGAGVGIGDGINAGAGVGVGIGTPTNPTTPTNPNNPNAPGLLAVVASMSPSELAKTKKRCLQVLSNSSSFESDLVALCKLVQTAIR